VKFEKSYNTKIKSGCLEADRAHSGSRATARSGVQLLHLSLFETKKLLLLSFKTPVFLGNSKQKKNS